MIAPLPIDAHLTSLVACVKAGRNLVLQAEPGAGKTTRVPWALLEAGLLDPGDAWILEPRRLAARMAATRIAEERNEPVGVRVGYAVRFEQKVSRQTRLRFVTEGLLLRRLQADPELKGTAVVVLDECHERHLHTDLALALLRRLQRTSRPDLRLVAMSATLDTAPLAAYLDAEVTVCPGRAHPVTVEHLPRPDDRPLAEQVQEAVARLLSEPLEGHVLVFLPGAAEIRAAETLLAPLAEARGLDLRPLHGSLSFEAQKAAVAPSERRKLLLSTNVAESSLTVDGVHTVVDSGLGREAVHAPDSGLSRLRTLRISQARCLQRTGRAGRLGPGRCLRLFTEADFRARPAFDLPEILRSDLAEAALALHDLGVGQLQAFPWFEAPPREALEAAERLLGLLGALDGDGGLSSVGRRLAPLPLHPRLARLVVAGEDLGIPLRARRAAALLEVGELRARSDLGRRSPGIAHGLDCDLWVRLDAFEEAEAAGFRSGAVRAAGLDPSALRQARLLLESLSTPGEDLHAGAEGEERILKALLRAYPDRVARRGGAGTYTFVGGGGARLGAESRVGNADLILALEAEGHGRETRIRLGARLEPEWLLEAFPEVISDQERLVFHEGSERVERRSALLYGDLVLDETRGPADPSDPAVAELLAEAALARNTLGDRWDGLLQRAAWLARLRPDLGLPEGEALRRATVCKAALGLRTLKELEAADGGSALRSVLGSEAVRLLEAWLPETVVLKGRRVRIDYGGEAPVLASRLQDFFGMKEAPRLAEGRLPLVLHLLAPNQRAVQVTTDLAGFWQRAYRELRPQLSRRYPKHRWPEDPLQG